MPKFIRSGGKYVSTPQALSPMDALQQQLESGLANRQVQDLYAGIHGSRGEWGVPETKATYFQNNTLGGNMERGLAMIPSMFPNAPPPLPSRKPYSHTDGGNVYLTPNADPGTVAHEYEHWQQGPTIMPDNVAGALAAEYGPSTLSQLMPMASWQSQDKMPIERTGVPMKMGPGYTRDLAWLHNQAQQHGVFGNTPIAHSLGYRGQGAVPITEAIAQNPQWFQEATGMNNRMPVRMASPRHTLGRPTPPKIPAGQPDLTGYLQ